MNTLNSIEYNSTEADSPADKAGLFSIYFQYVFTSVDNLDYPSMPPFQSDTITHINVSYDNVNGVVRTTNVNKTLGPDIISGVILRECAKKLAGQLYVFLTCP